MTQLRILGFTVCAQFKETMKKTWADVFRKFQKTLFSWSSRSLVTLQQRVSVARTFALSKLWYVAQVLPLPRGVAKKIHSALSTFIFCGRSESLKLSEIENSPERGGLGLPCVVTKAECLLLRQTIRILIRPEQTCYLHLGYWLGNFIGDDFPDLVRDEMVDNLQPRRFPLQSSMLEALQEGLMRN